MLNHTKFELDSLVGENITDATRLYNFGSTTPSGILCCPFTPILADDHRDIADHIMASYDDGEVFLAEECTEDMTLRCTYSIRLGEKLVDTLDVYAASKDEV